MQAQILMTRLAAGPATFTALTAEVDTERARWRPAPERWSIVEVLAHLADEERLDFRTRLDLTLHQPETPWPAIDPEGWVRERDYQGRELADVLDDFLHERQKSLIWFGQLGDADFDRAHEHPRLGPIRAGDLLASWAMHDLLHLRQIAALHRARLLAEAEPYSADYAGPW